MKHLPNELLYLLKVYNYVKYTVGLDKARSSAPQIRAYIAGADFLAPYPTVLEYLSEDRSIDDIITYVQRNERTYDLLARFRDRETEMLLEQKGIDASLNIKGRFSLKKEDRDAYFLLPDAPCKMKKILLKNATVSGNTETADILWLELYRMGDCYYLEIFDDECRTLKVSFDDLSCGTHFLSALPLASCCKSSYEALTRVSSHILEKHLYDPSILCESEKELLPCIKLFAHLCTSHPIENDDAIEARSLFKEAGIEQGLKLLKDDSYCSNEKKALSISKKLARLLKSKKCDPLKKVLLERILLSQEHIGI